jgi:hypothetical protein
MRTDTDNLARVSDPAIELLLNHTATLADKWCSHRAATDRPVDNSACASASSGGGDIAAFGGDHLGR